jgi:hypothetical protein
MSALPPEAAIPRRHLDVRYGSWVCKNAPAEALTAGDLGEVVALGHFAEFFVEFCLEVRLMRILAILGGSTTADGRMVVTTMPSSPP